jgi:broad specificity phosphatase PhoE
VGRGQARELASAVADLDLAAIYTSPLQRAVETAEIVAGEIGRRPITDERLTETDVGRWQARSRDELRLEQPALYRTLRRHPERFRYPDGESLAEHRERTREAIADIAAGPLPALAVCHLGTIRCALSLTHPDGLAAWKQIRVSNTEVVVLPRGSVLDAQCGSRSSSSGL